MKYLVIMLMLTLKISVSAALFCASWFIYDHPSGEAFGLSISLSMLGIIHWLAWPDVEYKKQSN